MIAFTLSTARLNLSRHLTRPSSLKGNKAIFRYSRSATKANYSATSAVKKTRVILEAAQPHVQPQGKNLN